MVGIHISQIQRYEDGQIQPTLDAIRKLAMALNVSTDMLLFEKDERGPDKELKLQFEPFRGSTRKRRRSSVR
jgi:transcriptional regulator with XRE-family HTH domain